MKWITIEEQSGEKLTEHYAYCDNEYYILKENADEGTLDRLILSQYLGYPITPNNIFEEKETGWYWCGAEFVSILRIADIRDIDENELTTVRNFVWAMKLDVH
jgi:hypothetical protein